jgi:hypothetical protein
MRDLSNNSKQFEGFLSINEARTKAATIRAKTLDKIGQHIKNFSVIADFADM